MDIIEIDPASWHQKAANTTIYNSMYSTPWGKCLIAVIEGALANLIFWNSPDKFQGTPSAWLKGYWGTEANIIYSEEKTASFMEAAIQSIQEPPAKTINLFLKGTSFQRSVWKALLEIPSCQTVFYQTIANKLKNPKAVRAVGRAIGKNPISLYIPCHRVLPVTGGIGGYAWGPDIKSKLVDTERLRYRKLLSKSPISE